MRTVRLPDGETVPALGLGTWAMGEDREKRAGEVRALRHGLDLGMTLIDTAEMYGEGGAEEVVGEAIAGRRDTVFVVSKVYPHNASREGAVEACERSLRRLGTDRIDLYLLHWRGRHPLGDTVAGFEALRRDGKIRHWGVSNLDVDDLDELWRVPDGPRCAADQVLFNVGRRWPERSVLPWCRDKGLPVMAYSPIEQGRLRRDGVLAAVGRRHGLSPFQVALAWVLAQDGVIAIPKAVRAEHLEDNRRAADAVLDAEDMAAIDREFPPPTGARPMEML